jgi:hypothetical protein
MVFTWERTHWSASSPIGIRWSGFIRLESEMKFEGVPFGYDAALTTVTSATPHELRFTVKDGKRILQQRWRIITYMHGTPIGSAEEWRDVPLVEEPSDV